MTFKRSLVIVIGILATVLFTVALVTLSWQDDPTPARTTASAPVLELSGPAAPAKTIGRSTELDRSGGP
jgi:hypothetical protein